MHVAALAEARVADMVPSAWQAEKIQDFEVAASKVAVERAAHTLNKTSDLPVLHYRI